MKETRVDLDGIKLRVCDTGTLVIGSGCAGFNAADWLYDFGVRDVILITEGINKGTSRNAGSDKQTYYKLSIAANEADSVDEMTNTLLGPGVNGDTALAEAASSLQAFFKLVNLGVPFPTNEYGEFVGYKTDHDPRQRATSAGPLTSKLMTEALERSVRGKGIPVIDRMQAVKLIVRDEKLLGVLAIDLSNLSLPNERFVYFRCDSAIMATGGPASVYCASVYPESQTGMTGMAIEAGAELCNFSEWQYGLASIGFRWNVSGTYQQVLPRYIAVAPDGTEREFLNDYFDDPYKAVDMVFLKGYQWPFDAAKTEGSSQIDMIVHRETAVLGNRVYMDFTRNPSCIDESGIDRDGFSKLSDGFSKLSVVTREYLEKSGAMSGTPIARLSIMNRPAIELFRNNGIDLGSEPLEVAVCAQHCNGGLAVDANWQTSIEGLYAAGEAAGTFGVYRPGGSALNSAQVGSMRAARHIARKTNMGKENDEAESGNKEVGSEIPKDELTIPKDELTIPKDELTIPKDELTIPKDELTIPKDELTIPKDELTIPKDELKHYINGMPDSGAGYTSCDFREKQVHYQKEMSRAAAFMRDEEAIRELVPLLQDELDSVFAGGCAPSDLPALLKYRDMLISDLALLSALRCAGEHFGSRGSSLYADAPMKEAEECGAEEAEECVAKEAEECGADEAEECVAKEAEECGAEEAEECGAEVYQGLAGYKFAPIKESEVNTALYTKMTTEGFESRLLPVRPIPERDTWFETVWNASLPFI